MHTADHAAARRAMVENQIATSSVTDPRLLAVLRRIPRELFLPESRRALAYSDASHPLGNGRVLAAPAVFARLIQLASIQETDRVLDIGPASGYSTAILAGMGREVLGVEADGEMVRSATHALGTLGIDNASVVAGDGWSSDLSTFDVIMVEDALDMVPEALVSALAAGGRLVCLLRQGPVGVATVLENTKDGIATRSAFNATLPPLMGAKATDLFVF